jgi:hypothetical protein
VTVTSLVSITSDKPGCLRILTGFSPENKEKSRRFGDGSSLPLQLTMTDDLFRIFKTSPIPAHCWFEIHFTRADSCGRRVMALASGLHFRASEKIVSDPQ